MRKQLLDAIGGSKRQYILFLLVLVPFILVFPIAFVAGFNINNSLLWLTGVVVLMYTVETNGLRLEMVRQNEMAIQPIVIATIEERWEQRKAPTSTYCMVLKNIGRGTALHIRVNDIEFAKVPGGRFVAQFETIDYLEASKDTVIDVRWHGEFDGEGTSTRQEDFTANLNPRFAEETYEVAILYEDISGKEHESLVRMGKGGIKLLKPRGGCV